MWGAALLRGEEPPLHGDAVEALLRRRGVTRALLEEVARRIAGDIVMSNEPGKAMRRWREFFAVTQAELARRMGVSPSVISDYEKGRRTPGAAFIRRVVEALLDADSEKGWETVRRLARMMGLHHYGAVLDMREAVEGFTLDELVAAVKGFLVNAVVAPTRIYGYTVLDSLSAITSLSGNEFIHIMGSTSQRALVFTGVTTGRSPMVAVRVAPIKPAAVVVHSPRSVDPLAIILAEDEGIPLIVSRARSIEELIEALRRLVE